MDKKTIQKLIENLEKEQLHELVCQIASASSSACQALLDYCQKKEKSDNSGFSDYLMDIVSTMCQQKEERLYLEDILSGF